MITDTLHVVHPRAAGIDVHKHQLTATVRVASGAGEPECETREFSALGPGLDALAAWLTSHGIEAAAMEGTGVYWRAPLDRLHEDGIEVQLLHAHQVKQLRGRKTDIEDSRWLARVCQFGLGRPSMVPDREFHGLRMLSRHRQRLVQERSRVRNRIQKVIDGAGVRVGGILSDVFGKNGRIILEGLVEGDDPRDILRRLTRHVSAKIEHLGDALSMELQDWERVILADLMDAERLVNARIGALDKEILKRLEPYEPILEILQTMPGIDRTAAAAILAETGPDMTVFPSAQAFAAWAGLAPGNNMSAGKRRASATRRGSRFLRSLLVEAAHGASRTKNCQFATFRSTLTARRGYKRAIVATAHKIARALYVMVRDQVPYRDPGTDYEALLVDRNAPRWLRQLAQFGLLQEQGNGTFRVNWQARSTATNPA